MKRARWGLYLGIGLPLICLLTPVLGFLHYSNRAKGELSAAKAEAARAGLPLELEFIQPPKGFSRADNAKDLYLQAYPLIPKDISKDLDAVVGSLYEGKGTQAEVRKRLGEWGAAISAARKATKKPVLWFDRNWALGMDLTFPELSHHRQLVQMMALQALEASRDGDPVAALNLIEDGFRAADHVGEEPVLISVLVQIAAEAHLVRAASYIVSENPTPRVIARAKTLKVPKLRPLSHYVEGEAVTTWQIAKRSDVREIVRVWSGDGESAQRYMPGFVVDSARAKLLRAFADLYRTSQIKDLETMHEAMKGLESRFGAGDGLDDFLVRAILPTYAGASSACLMRETRLNIWRCGVATLDTKLRTGKYPPELPNLGEHSLDLLGKGKLGYKSVNGRRLIYSVGLNGRDEGGQRGASGADDTGHEF